MPNMTIPEIARALYPTADAELLDVIEVMLYNLARRPDLMQQLAIETARQKAESDIRRSVPVVANFHRERGG